MIALAVIAAVIALLLSLPAAALVRYEDGALRVRLQVGPVTAAVYPRRPAKPKKASKKQPTGVEKKSAAKANGGTVGKKLTPQQIRALIDLGLEVLGDIRRKLLVKHLTLHVFFGGRDAAKAAIGYGRAWAVIGGMMPVLENTFRIDERDVGAYLDYELEEPRLLLDLDVRMRVGTALALALRAGVRLLGIFTKSSKHKVNQGGGSPITKKAVQANEPSSF